MTSVPPRLAAPATEPDAETVAAVGQIVDLVRRIRVPGALNLYDEAAGRAWGDEPGEATRRALALRGHLVAHWAAPTVLVGEAPGQDGARRTGVPFTSCRQLCGSGPTEATATTVRRVLVDLGKEHQVLLWNASMLFAPGNRDPRRAEVDACARVLDLVCRGRAVFAIGRFAEAATGAPYIRHPSHGGASRFADGLRIALLSPPGTDVREVLARQDTSCRVRPGPATGGDVCRFAADRTLD